MKRAVARWSRDDETRSRSCQKPKWTKIFENRSKSLNLACAVLDQAATCMVAPSQAAWRAQLRTSFVAGRWVGSGAGAGAGAVAGAGASAAPGPASAPASAPARAGRVG